MFEALFNVLGPLGIFLTILPFAIPVVIFVLLGIASPGFLPVLLYFGIGGWLSGELNDLFANPEFIEWLAGTSFAQWLMELLANSGLMG